MTELGAGSGVKILQDRQRLLVLDFGTSSLTVVVFVLGLLTFILGSGGVALAATGATAAGLGLIGAAALLGLGLALAVRTLLHRRRRAPDSLPPSLIIDLAARTLCDGGGGVLAPLEQVRFHRKLQLGSSSPALAASFGRRQVVLARGNPFAGGLGTLEDALRGHGLM